MSPPPKREKLEKAKMFMNHDHFFGFFMYPNKKKRSRYAAC